MGTKNLVIWQMFLPKATKKLKLYKTEASQHLARGHFKPSTVHVLIHSHPYIKNKSYLFCPRILSLPWIRPEILLNITGSG